MEVRFLEETELEYAAGLCRFVFDNCLRIRMDFPQTISFVEEYLTESNFKKQKEEGKLLLWGVYAQRQLLGVAAMQTDGLITALYVLPQCAKRGCGKALLNAMRIHAREVLGLKQLVVNANPAWTSYYFKKFGFRSMDTGKNMQVPFVPMQASLDSSLCFQKKRVSGLAITLTIVGCFLFASIIGIGYMISYVM